MKVIEYYVAISHNDNLKNCLELTGNYTEQKVRFTRKILPDERNNIMLSGSDPWTNYIRHADGKLMRVFVFEQEVFEKHTWAQLSKGMLYSKKLKYSKQDLEDTNWQIVLSGK